MHFINDVLLLVGGSASVSLVVKATVIAALGLVGAWLGRGSRAAVRHAVLAASFAALFALPVVSFLVPPVRIAVAHEAAVSNLPEVLDSVQPSAPMGTDVVIRSRWSFPPLEDLWIVGALLFLLRIVVGLRQVYLLRRFGLPWREGQVAVERIAVETGVRRHVEVLLHDSLAAPVTCGFVRPAIVLPPDARDWDGEDLGRAILHELEHVRRWDWASQCFARVVCAVYWFHPLVWILWRRFVLEAERACDDAVLRRSEATAYADQLVELAQRLSTCGKPRALAMASRSDLSSRVRAVLDSKRRRGRAGKILVTIAFSAAALVVVTMSPLRMVAAPQLVGPPPPPPPAPPPPPFSARVPAAGSTCAVVSPSAAGYKFDAASVKPAGVASGGGMWTINGGPGTSDPGRVTTPRMSLFRLIQDAYDLPNDQISGPAWIVDGFNSGYEVAATMPTTTTRQQYCGMLRNLLTERFHLTMHREAQGRHGYELVVAKGGSKLKKFTGSTDSGGSSYSSPLEAGQFPKLPPTGLWGSMISGSPLTGVMMMSYRGPLLSFANGIAPFVGWSGGSNPGGPMPRVSDKTGLDGNYEIHLAFGGPRAEGAGVGSVDSAPTIFDALVQQLGLRLQKVKDVSVDVLIVDHVDRTPTKN